MEHKKIIIFILFFVIFSGLTKVVQGAATTTLSLNPSFGDYITGDVFDVEIELDTGGNNTDGVDIHYLNYNPELLEAQLVSPGLLYANTNANNIDQTNGRIDFSQTSAGGNSFNGQGILATIKFEVLAEGTANVTFDFTFGSTTDTNVASLGQDVLDSVVNGQYQHTFSNTVFIGSASAIPGAAFSVPIYIGNHKGVFAMDISLKYDSDVLTVTGVAATNLTTNWWIDFNVIDKELQVGMFSLDGKPLSAPGTLCNVQFRVNPAAFPGQTTPLDLTEALVNEAPTKTIDGEFTVLAPPEIIPSIPPPGGSHFSQTVSTFLSEVEEIEKEEKGEVEVEDNKALSEPLSYQEMTETTKKAQIETQIREIEQNIRQLRLQGIELLLENIKTKIEALQNQLQTLI